MVINPYLAAAMMIQSENLKGIEFIRISNLPTEQKALIVRSIAPEKIIKILKDNRLMIDCVQRHHYHEWYVQVYKPVAGKATVKA